MLKRFLEQFVKEMDVDMPQQETQGVYEYVVSPHLTVSLLENPDKTIRLFSVLTEVPNKKKEEYLHFAMTANLFGEEVGGNFLGLDRAGCKVTLARFVHPSAEYQDFRAGMEEFLNYAETWKTDTEVYLSS